MAKNCQNINGHQVVRPPCCSKFMSIATTIRKRVLSSPPPFPASLIDKFSFTAAILSVLAMCGSALFARPFSSYGFVSKLWPLPFLLSNKLSRHMLCVSVCAMAYLCDACHPAQLHFCLATENKLT